MNLQYHFDSIVFDMLTEFRIYAHNRGGKVDLIFAQPLEWQYEEKGYSSTLGAVVSGFNPPGSFRLGLVIFFPFEDLPNDSSRNLRSVFRRDSLRAKKKLIKQYKEIEKKYGYLERPDGEGSMGSEISTSIQQYL